MSKYPFGLSLEELEAFTWGDSEAFGWKPVTDEKIIEQDRWTTYYYRVFTKDGSFISMSWGRGSTEYQEVDFDPYVYIVEPYEVTVTKYRKV